MQVVRNAGSWLLRSWIWPPTTRVAAGAPAPAIHTGAWQLQDAAAKPEVEKAAAPTSGGSSFSIYPPIPGQESSLRWAGKRFEEIPIAHIKASYNNTQIQVMSAANQPLARASCGTEGFRNAKKGTGIAAQTAGIAAAAVPCSLLLSVLHCSRLSCASFPVLRLVTSAGASPWSSSPCCPRWEYEASWSSSLSRALTTLCFSPESCREGRDPHPSCGERPGARALEMMRR
uniref:Mitochondrial ribosomal protein S11 n=1 Tax=Equus caballus TaxID=9796 RepID=A0A9L0R426_HORSE